LDALPVTAQKKMALSDRASEFYRACPARGSRSAAPCRQQRFGLLRSKGKQGEFAMSEQKWSGAVTEHSDALDLEKDIFESKNPKAIARSLKRSAEHSRRRKAEPFRSAMSMLTFYINRAGRKLAASQRKVLERAKTELRVAFGRAPR
jgi:hypothetical protein